MIIFICFFSLFYASLFCQQTAKKSERKKQKEDLSLFEIDRLIRKTEYDEALRQLNIYLENNPENFDNAQVRIGRIMNARKQYSLLAEKLIDLILTDPNNNKEIYEITARLERFERNPSDANLQFIADLKKSAEFNYFRSLFTEIQTETAQLTEKKDYVGAIEKAKEGFWLYRENYDIRWEDSPEILKKTESILTDLNQQILIIENKDLNNKLNTAVNNFIKAVEQEDYNEAGNQFENVKNYLIEYSAARRKIYADGFALQSLFDELKQIDEDSTDASFLPFMFRFIFGIESIPDSGIAGAINAQWNSTIGRMNESVFKVVTLNYNRFTSAFEKNISSTENEAQSLTRMIETLNKAVSLNSKVLATYSLTEVDRKETIKNPYEDYLILNDYLVNIVNNSQRLYLVNSQVNTESKKQQLYLENLKSDTTDRQKSEIVGKLLDSTAKMGELVGEKSKQELSSYKWALNYEKLEADNWKDLTALYTLVLDKVFKDSSSSLNGAWTEISSYYKERCENFVAEAENYYQISQKYKTGFYQKVRDPVHKEILKNGERAFYYADKIETDSAMDFGIIYSYPDISKNSAVLTLSYADAFIQAINGFEILLNSNFESHQQWKVDEGISSIITNFNKNCENNKNELTQIKNKAVVLGNESQSLIVKAQVAKNEAEIRFSEAETALRKGNFDLARRKLQDSLSKYDECLTYQNNEDLRIECDYKLQSLGERITKSENELVVKEVRELKNQAKDAYFNGRFDDAEKLLNQAKIRWAVTNSIEDEEIKNLQNFVNTAISMKTGREILVSAPQYPEMSQLLNIAYEYYNKGESKIKSGNREEGIKDLDQALESIQKLQYVYPLHQESAILTLKINRLKDPKKFADEFGQKVQSARQMCKSPATQQEGYSNLLDYYELEPGYKGLKELIYQVEIDIGIRQKPVDNSAKNKAKNLYNEANKLYNSAGKDVAKLNNALAKIEQSLSLNSDDRAAMELKDKITTRIGGSTSTVLSTEDERLYQLAIQRLQNNKIIEANAIVEQLLKKPQNTGSQKIKDLKVKIDARS